MKYEIEIESQDDDLVIFYIHDTPYTVEIETEILTDDYPVSFNSFNDRITYAQDDSIYYLVNCDTLECSGINYYQEKDICKQLEEILNRA